MADLIEKIGRFFAEQEAQIQDTLTQVVHASTRSSLPHFYPPPPVHRIPSHLTDRGSPNSNPVSKPRRKNSIRRRRSVNKTTTEPTQSRSWQDDIDAILTSLQPQNTGAGSSNSSSIPSRPTVPKTDNGILPSDELVSWRSSSSLSSRALSTRDEDRASQPTSEAPEKHRKPRPPHQKHHKRSRKKKRSNNQEEERPDLKATALANAEKVAAALTLAQERAKRIQQEKLQLERERELERQEAACRLQEQMVKIEAVRARSFRHNISTISTARSTLSNDTESVWTADSNDMNETEKHASEFMIALEAQLREKMSLEMHVKQRYIEKYKKRERVRLKLEKVAEHNAVHRSKVARLAATKASLEMELAAVLEETAQTRQKRRELELADEKERLKRQREAERALQIRLREEEWENMMEDEKARSQVAAEARAKASKRVEAHSAKLRKLMHAFRYEPRRSSSSTVSSSARDNDDSDEERNEANSQASTGSMDKSFKMDLLLRPELAGFEEDGLCNTSELLQPESALRWQVPSFSDPDNFMKVLVDMVSDDEE